MSDFQVFARAVNQRVLALAKLGELFVVDYSTDELWAQYLGAFPEGTNPVFRTNTTYDCSCCRNFIKNVGRVVTVVNGRLQSVWDIDGLPAPFDVVAHRLKEQVVNATIQGPWLSSERLYGAERTPQLFEGRVINWEHFWTVVPSSCYHKEPGPVKSKIEGFIQVFRRGLTELTLAALDEVLELHEQNQIYRGAEFVKSIKGFRSLLVGYNKATLAEKEFYVWANYKADGAIIRNTMIGQLIQDLSAGKDLEASLKTYEKMSDAANYKRPKAAITKKMVEDANSTIEQLGLAHVLQRRFATLADISVTDVLYVDQDTAPAMKGGIMDLLAGSVAVQPVKGTDKAEEITADEFLAKVVPATRSMEVLVEGRHQGNFVSLTAPMNGDTADLFQWGNDFGWSYDGNVTDSLRQRVADLGGRVDGDLRFSHTWNYDGGNQSLMDLHVFMPGQRHTGRDGHWYGNGNGRRVGWNKRRDTISGGVQDVDYTAAPGKDVPVENITFPSRKRLEDGEYQLMVHNYHSRMNPTSGFQAEVEFDGQVFQYEHTKPVPHNAWVTVATVTLAKGVFSIVHGLKPGFKSVDKWSIQSGQFVKVDTLCHSPNHWGNNAVGAKHTIFALRGCNNPEPVRGLYNEFLSTKLAAHRKVFEVLGDRTKCPVASEQVSGLGFTAARGDSVVVKVATDRRQSLYKVNF